MLIKLKSSHRLLRLVIKLSYLCKIIPFGSPFFAANHIWNGNDDHTLRFKTLEYERQNQSEHLVQFSSGCLFYDVVSNELL